MRTPRHAGGLDRAVQHIAWALVLVLAITQCGCALFGPVPASRPNNTAPESVKRVNAAAHELCDPLLGAAEALIAAYDTHAIDGGAALKDASASAESDTAADAAEGN